MPFMAERMATCNDGEISIKSPYNKEYVKDITTIFKKYKWDSGRRVWILYAWHVNKTVLYSFFSRWKIEKEKDFDKKFDESIKKRETAFKNAKKTTTRKFDYDKPKDIIVMPHQEVALKYMLDNGNVLIADDTGLGKTGEAFLYARNTRKYPILVFCFSVSKINWKREAIKWLELDEKKIFIIEGKKPLKRSDFAGKEVIIVNYQIVEFHLESLDKEIFKLAIIDECQELRNRNAKKTKSILCIVEDIPSVLALSATPMINKPIELYPILQALKKDKGDFEFWTYVKRYCGAVNTKYGMKFDGATNLEELNDKLLHGVMLRRSSADVLKDLPPKNRQMFFVEIDKKIAKKYSFALHDYREYRRLTDKKKIDKGLKFAMIESLKQLAIEGKKKSVIDFMASLHEKVKKLIIFAHHEQFLDFIEETAVKNGIKTLRIGGYLTTKGKQQVVDEFNSLDDVILVSSIKCAGTSINLQTCNNVIFAELTWTSADHYQAEGRVHRIGQDKPCNIYYIIADQTIEEHIFQVICRKEKMAKKSIE